MAHIPPSRPAHGIIPARYGSTRFPGKALTLLHGKPMFWHVWQRACQCPGLASVTLATDDERIATAATSLGVPWRMTASSHESGTDRVHEAAVALGLPAEAIILNIQGDEPALNPAALSQLLTAFDDASVQAATLAHVLDADALGNPDKVKVTLALNSDALYFSRAGIPFAREPHARPLGHIGLYAFTMKTLARFVSLPPSPLERTEKLEQLRLLENNIPIRVILTEYISHGVDSPEDLERVLPLMS